MKKLFIFAVSFAAVIFLPNPAEAVTASHLVISQIQITGGPGKTAEESPNFMD